MTISMEKKYISMEKKYRYRNGTDARILCVDCPHLTYPVISLNQHGCVVRHLDNGESSVDGGGLDLIEIKPKIEGWLNIYGPGDSAMHPTRAEADRFARKTRLACVFVSAEESEGIPF